MNPKRFFIAVLAGVLVCFCALSAFAISGDPFFVLSGLEEGDLAEFDNQRYQMGGLIRNQEYSAIVMGTSLVANYRASWFTQGLGKQTLKVTFPDGWISEFDTALSLAFRAQKGLDTVLFCMDPNIMIRPDSQRAVELPGYLYDLNPLNDVEYLLNVDTYQLVGRGLLKNSVLTSLDEAYVWDGAYTFSWGNALAGYPRPAVSQTTLPADTYLEAVEENLSVVCAWIEEHPDTEFIIWLPPYSILYWDKCTREGSADAVLTAVEHMGERLLDYDNVTFYLFTDDYEVITDLNNYTDHIHCSGEVTSYVAHSVMDPDLRVADREELSRRVAELRDYVSGYDYTLIFPET